jgi:hypothetical protein
LKADVECAGSRAIIEKSRANSVSKVTPSVGVRPQFPRFGKCFDKFFEIIYVAVEIESYFSVYSHGSVANLIRRLAMKAFIPGSVVLCLALVAGSGLAQTSVLFDGVTNVSHDSVLSGGSTHTFTVRFDAGGAPAGRSYLTSTGFRIYSPDGADWIGVQGAALGPFTSLGWQSVFVNHFDIPAGTGRFGFPLTSGGGNDSGDDTVVVLLAGLNSQPGGGLSTGFNDQVLQVQFQSRRADAGRHICIDSCQGAPGGAWEWAHADGLIEPTWSGARCFVIGCCAGMVGDVNGVDGDEPTLGDIMILVDYLFLDGAEPNCLEEADVNQLFVSGRPASAPVSVKIAINQCR